MPCCADDEGIDVHADHGKVAPAVAVDVTGCGCGGRIGSHDITTNVPHRNASKRGTPNETIAATNALDNNEGERAHAKGFCDAIETCREELEGGTGDTQSLEDTGSVVSDDVDLIFVSDVDLSPYRVGLLQ